MIHLLKKIGRELFSFFASLQLAVVLLVTLAVVLAVGTYYESLYNDAAAAQRFVYGTVWFSVLLGLLGVNVLFAALSRYPWQRRHTGFLIVHLGIIILLLGSLVTLFQGYEGQVIFSEGETKDRINLKKPQLFFYDANTARLEEVPADFQYREITPERAEGAYVLDRVLVKIDQYLPNALSELEVSEAQEEGRNPALQVQLNGSQASMKEWLFSRDFAKQRLALGPASLSFIEVPRPEDLEAILADPKLRGPVLWADGKYFPVKDILGQEIPFEGKTLLLQNYVPHAGVHLGKLINLSERPENPVVKITLKGREGEEQHTLFAKFPELSSFQKQVFADSPKLRLLWIPEELGTARNELVLAFTDAEKIFYRLKQQDRWAKVQALSSPDPVATGWMDFQFSLSNWIENARTEKKYRRAIVPKEQAAEKGPPPALHLVLSNSEATQSLWLGLGELRDVVLGSQTFKVGYGPKMVPLGFALKLNDFQMGTYEGTKDASKYESHVTVIDESLGAPSERRIAMNHPLKHGKYKVFQASYQIDPDGKQWSVLAVAYDPGIFLKYSGSLILVLGVVIIFYFKQGIFKKRKVAQSESSVFAVDPLLSKVKT